VIFKGDEKLRSWESLKEEYTKDALYYLMNGFEDVTEEMKKIGIHPTNYGKWEMNGYKYETWNKHIYRKKK
jgi:hypothetical protein